MYKKQNLGLVRLSISKKKKVKPAKVVNYNINAANCNRDGTGQNFLDPTRPVNFKIIAGWPAGRPAGWPVSDRPGRPFFLRKVFLHYSMYLMKNFQKGGGMDDVLKFVTLDGGLRKKNGEWFLCFLQKWLNFKTFFGYVLVWVTCFAQRTTCTK